MKRHVVGIKFRLIALGACLCMAGVLLRHYVALPVFQHHVQELVASQQASTASYVAREVEHSIAARLDLVRRLGADLPPALLSQPPALQQWMAERQRINPLFNGGLMVVTPAGRRIGAMDGIATLEVPTDFSAAPWLARASAASDAVLSRPVRMGPGETQAILFSMPVHGADGKVAALLAGIAVLGVPGFLDDFLPGKGPGANGLLLVSPTDRLFIAASDPAMMLRPTPPAGVNPLHDRAMAGFRGTGLTTNAKGVEELSAVVSVIGTDWFVAARIPAEQAFRAVTKVRAFMIKATAASIVLLMLLMLLGLSRILRPLVSAARAIHDMADGKRDLAALPVLRDDEVGKLIRVFNVLVERLHAEEAARRASEARLVHMAHHDSLTGLYNRAMLENRLTQELARCERNRMQMALMFCDLDGFKAINDEFGHHTGDAVLCQVAARLTAHRRRVDTVARLGGDEFVILLSDLADAHTAAGIVAEQCMGDMRIAFDVEGKQFNLGMSMGIVLHAGKAVAPAELLSLADAAMYQAKRQGKGRFVFMDAAPAQASA